MTGKKFSRTCSSPSRKRKQGLVPLDLWPIWTQKTIWSEVLWVTPYFRVMVRRVKAGIDRNSLRNQVAPQLRVFCGTMWHTIWDNWWNSKYFQNKCFGIRQPVETLILFKKSCNAFYYYTYLLVETISHRRISVKLVSLDFPTTRSISFWILVWISGWWIK